MRHLAVEKSYHFFLGYLTVFKIDFWGWISENCVDWSFLKTNWMGYHQGHDCCALVHQNKSTHSYISPFFFIHSARCRNFFSAKKWAHFLCITWRSLSLFQITIKDKNKKPWWWKKGGHLKCCWIVDQNIMGPFLCACVIFTLLFQWLNFVVI